ncbi:MAG: pyridoxal 5'-phosphate synthase glutaminase subunit PdxT [Spirochaetales bacterium]|nr:pyridoxal 5'-phosphate synthase glutaminase subunit PdxT [Spirochaetales bacterium]
MGILALQGDVAKHATSIEKAGARTTEVRNSSDLDRISGLIIPGGESTTIGKLLVRFSLLEPLRKRITEGLPVFGTCAGTILLADTIISKGNKCDQPHIGTMDITVSRNAYGPQIESFETDITLTFSPGVTLRAVFIRAPVIVRSGKKVEVLGVFENTPVLLKQANMLAATFHPELTDDIRIHEYFCAMTKK